MRSITTSIMAALSGCNNMTTNPEMNHTPLPWHVEFDPDDSNDVWGIFAEPDEYKHERRIIETDMGYYPPKKVDAEFIVRAVNCHAELLEAVKLCLTIPGFALLPEIRSNLMDVITKAEGK